MELLLNMSVPLSMAFGPIAHLAEGQINNNNNNDSNNNNNDNNNCYYSFIYY
jgi:hypothetical protein